MSAIGILGGVGMGGVAWVESTMIKGDKSSSCTVGTAVGCVPEHYE